ncbi:MAG: hypothetical protein HYT12_01415 [Candidatus Liptonbacteria bacterium]|nr:hypothetical protein [Candidatus Liptonbacteria bacterium]
MSWIIASILMFLSSVAMKEEKPLNDFGDFSSLNTDELATATNQNVGGVQLWMALYIMDKNTCYEV